MDFGWSEEHEQFRQELRAFIQKQLTPELQAEHRNPRFDAERGPARLKFREALNEAGHTTIARPPEYGGRGKGGLNTVIPEHRGISKFRPLRG